MAVRVVRGPGQGAPVVVTLPADPAATFAYGKTVSINAATNQVVLAPSNLIIGIALGASYGSPKVVDVQLFQDSLIEVTENIAEGSAFSPGQRIWLKDEKPGRAPDTPAANTSYYLVLRKSVQKSVNSGDLPLISYLVVPFGLKHGWFELA